MILAVDNFNRADANPLSGNWQTYSTVNALQIVSNQVEGAVINAAVDCYETNTVTLPNDQWAQVTIASFVGGTTYGAFAILLRFAAPNTLSGYYGLIDKTGAQARITIEKLTAGVTAVLGGPVNITVTNGDAFRFEALGQQLTMFQNGAQAVQVASDASYTSGLAGLECYPTVAVTDVVLANCSCGGLGFMGQASL